MILPWPLTLSAELAAVLKPGQRLQPDSALRKLRDLALAAPPMSTVPRADGTARGRKVWYSSLMVEVARLVRQDGDLDVARALRDEADALSQHPAAAAVTEFLTSCDDPVARDVDAATGGALTRLALLTESARRRYVDSLGVHTWSGVIEQVDERSVTVRRDSHGREVIPLAPASPLAKVGTCVSVAAEDLSFGASTIWVRPAFDGEPDVEGDSDDTRGTWVRLALEGEVDPHERVPGAPLLLGLDARDDAAARR